MLLLCDNILDRNSFRQKLLGLDQLIPLLQDVAQVVHGVDVGRMQSGSRRKQPTQSQLLAHLLAANWIAKRMWGRHT